MTAEATNKQTPQQFFETIGDKVSKFAQPDGVETAEDDDHRAVEEIESLCMNCGENVSLLHPALYCPDDTNLAPRE
jgi:zinc finger protein